VSLTARIDWVRWLWALGMAAVAAPLGLLAGFEPRFAIAAALGAAFVLIAFENLASGLALFGYLAFIELIPVEGPVLSVTKLLGLLLALAWFAVLTTGRRGDLDFFVAHPFVSAALGLFFGWAVISMVWAEDPSLALGSATRYGLNLILFLIVFTAIRTEKDLGRVLLGFMLGAATAAVFGILTPTDPTGARLGSELLDPNDLAASLVSGAALAAGVAVLYRGAPLVRVAAAATGLFCATAVWLTASRGGLIALGIAAVCAIVVAGRWRPQVSVAIVVFAAASYVYFAAFAPVQVQERITEPAQGQARLEEGRTTIWQVAWRAYEANPVQGLGAGNFEVSSKHYLFEPGVLGRTDEIIDRPKVVHNSYLGVLSELGTVGFGLFMLILGFAVGSMLMAARFFGKSGNRRLQAVSLSLAVAVLGNLAAGFFFTAEYNKELWLLLGLGPALLSLSKAGDPSVARPGLG